MSKWTAEEFLVAYPDTEIRENRLVDIACPECGSRSAFSVITSMNYTMDDDDLEPSEGADVTIENDAWTTCFNCEFTASIKDFMIPGLDQLLRTNKEAKTSMGKIEKPQ